jgi:hypothetical protein
MERRANRNIQTPTTIRSRDYDPRRGTDSIAAAWHHRTSHDGIDAEAGWTHYLSQLDKQVFDSYVVVDGC